MTLLDYRTEYEQANELFRHYQTMQFAVIPLFIAAFSMQAVSWVITQLNLLFVLSFLSMVLFLAWFNVSERYSKRTILISRKICELEEILGVSLHTSIKNEYRRNSQGWLDTAISYAPETSLVLLAILWIVRLILTIPK